MLPHVGDLIELDETVGMVIARNDRKRGTVLTVMHGGDGLAHTIQTRTISRLPSGWRVLTGRQVHQAVAPLAVL